MPRKLNLLATLSIFAASPILAQTVPSGSLFGARPMIEHIDISPDGEKIVYITPGPGPLSAVMVAKLSDGVPKPVLASSGDPEHLAWCNFVSNDRLICNFRGLAEVNGALVPFSRMASLNADGTDVKQLGQHDQRE